MSGARLEAAGQLRNVVPYLARTSVSASLSLVSGALSSEAALTFTEKLPFDTGPDKSSRVFIALTGLFLRITAQAFAPTAPTISGFFYYKTLEGKKIYLTAIEGAFTSAFTESNPTLLMLPDTFFSASNIQSLGYFGYEDIATSLGSATSITITARLNIGMYGDYAEPDWNTLFQMREHEHTGMPVGSYNELSALFDGDRNDH